MERSGTPIEPVCPDWSTCCADLKMQGSRPLGQSPYGSFCRYTLFNNLYLCTSKAIHFILHTSMLYSHRHETGQPLHFVHTDLDLIVSDSEKYSVFTVFKLDTIVEQKNPDWVGNSTQAHGDQHCSNLSSSRIKT